MKKILLALAVILVCTALIGGFTYAQSTHTSVTGNKIVGFGHVYDNDQVEMYDPQPGEIEGYPTDYDPPAYISGGYRDLYVTNFSVINPNCDVTITINQVSVIAGDGTLIDEWKLSDDPGTWVEGLILGDVAPHAEWLFASGKSIIGNYDLSNSATVTLEVSYSAKARKYLPLQGTAQEGHIHYEYVPTEQEYWPAGLPLPAEPVLQRENISSVAMVNY